MMNLESHRSIEASSDHVRKETEVNAYDVSNSSRWGSYSKYRPKYPPELFERVYDFHDVSGGTYHVAHDAGCGPGMTASVLAQKFKHVVCSDFAEGAVAAAKENLEALSEAGQISGTTFTFRQSAAKDMSWIEPASLDMVTMSECLHWTDTARTLSAVAKVLKVGGTFATWYYCDPMFPENAEVKAIYYELLSHWMQSRADWSEVSNRTIWIEMTGYDCIGFPESDGWARGVKRIKFNTNKSMEVWERWKEKTWMKYKSQIGEHDILEYVEDAEEWQFQADIDWITGWFKCLQPALSDDFLQPYLYRIEQALGGKQGQTKIAWPVVLILAKKDK